MIFSIQRFIEDYLSKRQLSDTDQYAVRFANCYDQKRDGLSVKDFVRIVRRIRTATFLNSPSIDRRGFEERLVELLDRKFKGATSAIVFPGSIKYEKRKIGKRRNILTLLTAYAEATEARAVDSFWASRKKGRLQSQAEKIAQGSLSIYFKAVLGNSGLVFREVGSGIGFVDVAVVIGRTPHLIEIKILKNKLAGVAQLNSYMKQERRRTGWLLLIDARPVSKKPPIPEKISVSAGIVKTIVVDINPIPPNRKK